MKCSHWRIAKGLSKFWWCIDCKKEFKDKEQKAEE